MSRVRRGRGLLRPVPLAGFPLA